MTGLVTPVLYLLCEERCNVKGWNAMVLIVFKHRMNEWVSEWKVNKSSLPLVACSQVIPVKTLSCSKLLEFTCYNLGYWLYQILKYSFLAVSIYECQRECCYGCCTPTVAAGEYCWEAWIKISTGLQVSVSQIKKLGGCLSSTDSCQGQ